MEEDEEVEEVEEDEEVEEVEINGKTYYTTNTKNGDIYNIEEDGDISEEPIGKYKKGVPQFF